MSLLNFTEPEMQTIRKYLDGNLVNVNLLDDC